VTSGTLQVYYWNELKYPSPFVLAASLDASNGTVQVQVVATPDDTLALLPNGVIQIDNELMTILKADASSNTYTVLRHALGSLPASHSKTAGVLPLDRATIVVPFANGFFENQASVNFLHTFSLPDVRVAAAQFRVTNSFGDSQAATNCYTVVSGDPNDVLRTLSGGQFSLQVNGYLATQQNAAPPLIVEAKHAVRDIRATLNEAASGFDIAITINQNGSLYQSLLIQSGNLISTVVVLGFDSSTDIQLLPLQEGAILTMDIALNPVTLTPPASPSPGRDLTITIRF
jgi:hypothetical protein